MIQLSWQLQILTEQAFESLLSTETRQSGEPTFEEWSQHRTEFCGVLQRHGKEDPGAGRSGDFAVDLDWYGLRKFSVCLISQQLYRLEVFREIQNFLRKQLPTYLVTVVGDFPKNPVLFTILLTKSSAFITLGARGRQGYEQIATDEPDIRDWLRILDKLTGNPTTPPRSEPDHKNC